MVTTMILTITYATLKKHLRGSFPKCSTLKVSPPKLIVQGDVKIQLNSIQYVKVLRMIFSFLEAHNNFEGRNRTVPGTAGIYATYPQEFVGMTTGLIDQVTLCNNSLSLDNQPNPSANCFQVISP